ncbi:hypothetical protein OG21DRAFT_1014461 [Imleria badia]|nr:hypothetical protein OG21DRAFT_1014461 [Imleria badia]
MTNVSWPRRTTDSTLAFAGFALASVKSFDPQYRPGVTTETEYLRIAAVTFALAARAGLVHRDSVHLSERAASAIEPNDHKRSRRTNCILGVTMD